MEELLEQSRLTNQLLRLAFGQQIEGRLSALASSPSASKVISSLGDDELSMDALQSRAGIPRSSLYAAVATLERLGVVERPRRGYIAISKAAGPYVGGLRRADSEGR
jgi:predicted Rossmann fold nucleotide-binding protein DprA/Smf involved in DNA uptake